MNLNTVNIDYYNEQKRLFIKIASEMIEKPFIIDNSNKQAVTDIFNYFMGVSGNLNPNKGLWIEGEVGTGKSTLMQAFSRFQIAKFNGFLIHICSHVGNQYSINGDLSKYTYNENGYPGGPIWMCFDELGRESIPANHFGQKLNVMQHILHIRYSLWQTDKLKTFVTTNLDADGVEELYGDFIRDRRKEMFNIISITGKSRRQ